jgi:hypothetical protein
MKAGGVFRASSSSILLGLLLGVSSCARKAPSPEQCVAFTELLVGATHEEILEHPAIKERFDAVVTTCLTKPFHKDVFICTRESRAPLQCLQRYEPELVRARDNLVGRPRRVR